MRIIEGQLKNFYPRPSLCDFGKGILWDLGTCDCQHTDQAPSQPPRKLSTPGAPHAWGRNRSKVGSGGGEGEWVSPRLIQVTWEGWEVTEAQGRRSLPTPSTPVLGRAPPIFAATPGHFPYHLRLSPLPPISHMLSLTSPTPTQG